MPAPRLKLKSSRLLVKFIVSCTKCPYRQYDEIDEYKCIELGHLIFSDEYKEGVHPECPLLADSSVIPERKD